MSRSAGMCTALACALAAQVAAGEGVRWVKITSPGFELFTTGGERGGRDVARHFEQVRAFFLETMNLGVKSGLPVRLVVFRSDKDFAPYAPNNVAAAFYLGAQDRDYIVMKSLASDQFPVAVHEYIHLLVKHTGIAAPVWFNEGLAELYSNLKPIGGKIEVGDIIAPHLLQLQQTKWIDLATLLAVQPDSPLYNEKSRVGVFYAESWALVHMLYLGAGYRDRLSILLDGIKTNANMPETFQKAYGKPLPAIQKDLERYMHGSSFTASLFNAKLAKEAEAPQAEESNALEAGLVLADILANHHAKFDAARQMYGELAHDYPKDWRVEQGWARLSLREGKRDEALEHYKRAEELGSTSAPMFLDYGRLLRVENQRTEALLVLKRATQLDPENRDGRLELGYAYLTANQHAEALAELKAVKSVTPDQAFGYFHAMAYAYYRLDKKAEAKSAAASCRKYAKTAAEIERIDQLVAAIDYVPLYPLLGGDSPHRGPGSGSGEDAPPPRQKRLTALAVAEGTLQQIDCLDGRFRVRIGVGSDTMSLAILNPAAVSTKNGKPLDFVCGPQDRRQIKVEYESRENPLPATSGVVRSIEFPE